MPDDPTQRDEEWRAALVKPETLPRLMRRAFGVLPAGPRCKMCNAPFKSWGGALMRQMGRPQSKKNPRYCEPCAFQEPGGAEVEISMLFADVRGSTPLAESMSAAEFGHLIGHFYEEATNVLVNADALVDRLTGDEVIGLFIPRMTGTEHARRAVEAAQQLRRRLGYDRPDGPWLPVGMGVHTGVAYVGVVSAGGDGPNDLTALGDNVNIAARLASTAASGEILISEAAYAAAGLDLGRLERRELSLKGKTETISVHVLKHTKHSA